MQSKFMKYFDKIRQLENKPVLRNNAIVVEIIEQEIKRGNIILAEKAHARGGIAELKSHLGIVLEVGQGYWNEDKKAYEPLDIPVGAVVVVPPYGCDFKETWPGLPELTKSDVAIVTDTSIQYYYESIKDYLEACKSLAELDT